MGRVIVTEFVSVDGVMEAPGGEPGYRHTGWTIGYPFTPEQGTFKLNEVFEADAHLLGRKTYESFAGAWPDRDDPEGFAARMNSMPKYVVSTTLKQLDWTNSHLISGNVPDEIVRLKEEVGDLLVAGSRSLVHTLYEHDLVDEYRLMVFPVVLGSGRRVFPDDAENKRPLELVATQSFSNGVAVQTFRRG
ncbi:MAG: dihydrofolate reductase family protein [Aeromicrobium sp.]